MNTASIVRVVTNSLVNVEHKSLESREALICKLIERLASSKESSLKRNARDGNSNIKNMTAEAENRRRQQQKELHTNSNISQLARFLLVKWQSQVSKNLNPA
ncbi:hypothetical protein SLA2020_238910 [Shorea laevis]